MYLENYSNKNDLQSKNNSAKTDGVIQNILYRIGFKQLHFLLSKLSIPTKN